jgi:hypothetical protein
MDSILAMHVLTMVSVTTLSAASLQVISAPIKAAAVLPTLKKGQERTHVACLMREQQLMQQAVLLQ